MSFTQLMPVGDGDQSLCLVTSRADEYKHPVHTYVHISRAVHKIHDILSLLYQIKLQKYYNKKPEPCMEQGKHKESIHKEAKTLPPRIVSRESDNEQNKRVLLETMDTDRCIQTLVRTELEGSECTQCKIEETIQYWATQEKEAAMNYHHTLELNNSVSNKRVQQLYSQDQSQEVIDQAERQASSAR